MVNEIDNIFLINAPAGSGKTTTIKNHLLDIGKQYPKAKVLCITYTNRAVDELLKDIDNNNIYVSTIHSYINDLIVPFYADKKILELYFQISEEKIKSRISNFENDEKIKISNQKYMDNHGELSLESLKENLKKLYYNEMPFSSLYYGGLSHDDLLNFAFIISQKHPAILKKISKKYDYIFIDEYQDTSADVLRIFYNAVKNTSTTLYLFGDKMQQIYKNYDGSFEKEFLQFNTEQKLKINYRSVPIIIDVLNKIYNDVNYNQEPCEENIDKVPDFLPELIISSNIEQTIEKYKTKFNKPLLLRLLNREKYGEIGALNLYSYFDSMDKYSFGKKYSANDVLADLSDDNPDLLVKVLFIIDKIYNLCKDNSYGTVISIFKKYSKIFNKNFANLKKHAEKKEMKESIYRFLSIYENNESTIQMILDSLIDCNILSIDFMKSITEMNEYSDILTIKVIEIRNLTKYLNNPIVSTQHGVKGESHDSVIFVANNSVNPNVKMYDFFDLWSRDELNISLTQIETFYYKYLEEVKKVETLIGMKTSALKSNIYTDDTKKVLTDESIKMQEKFSENEIFNILYKNDYVQYERNNTVTNAKKIFNINKLYGVIAAYRLFYVGCSRARKNFVIIVDTSKINLFKDRIIKKIKFTGIQVNDEENM